MGRRRAADVDFDSSDKSEMVDSMLESAAEVEEQNRRAREGYSESSLGVNNSIDPFKLVPGEYVVHRKYGIGQFLGHKVLPIENENGDVKSVPFLFLKYADATARITPESSRRFALPVLFTRGARQSAQVEQASR
jgi:transcription-repair coupling factor (superfamily II helicase)